MENCKWDVSDIGEPKQACGEPLQDGKNWCTKHQSRLPFWPTGEKYEEKVQAPETSSGLGPVSGGTDEQRDKVAGEV